MRFNPIKIVLYSHLSIAFSFLLSLKHFFYPVASNSGRTSCSTRETILLGLLRGPGSGRRKASNHSVSESCQRSNCGLRKCVSRRRPFLTSVISHCSDES